jgi:hypothetical protein
MADYFTNFSLILPLPTETAERYALNLAEQAGRIQQGDDGPDDFPATLREVVEDWYFDTDPSDPANGWGLWLHASSGGIDAVCAFIQHLLERFDPTAHVGLEWSNDCSRPRVNAYGGGAALITAGRIVSISTGQWLHRHIARLTSHHPRRRQPSPPTKH